ncbi:MAG: Oxygen-dependent coproporphyrinogen-III oxidase [Chlamydiia bacterium]|nr:Oxygen-dependent coproporphyrinogen-III oxidase [Chlamydiia bacterium]
MNKEKLTTYLKDLQLAICTSFESFEVSSKFERKDWDYKKGSGGGSMRVLRGDVFEKAAVNFSAVSGDTFPMKDGSGPFFATGVSLITHMKNPHMPTVHMNVRYIETDEGSWFGGGYDLTPMGFAYEEDTKHFHSVAKESLDPIDQTLYPEFSKNAKEYFYIPHRKKERGVGGLFFDHYNTGDPSHDMKVFRAIAENFLSAIIPIYEKRKDSPFTQEDKAKQLTLRAHYVEFNLIYDRGTKFGFSSGGNPEAILCSMPPVAAW